jgi:hypothetical protein
MQKERGRYPGNVATAAVPRMNPASDVGSGRKRLQGAAARWKRWEMSRQRSTNDGERPGSIARPGMWEGRVPGQRTGCVRGCEVSMSQRRNSSDGRWRFKPLTRTSVRQGFVGHLPYAPKIRSRLGRIDGQLLSSPRRSRRCRGGGGGDKQGDADRQKAIWIGRARTQATVNDQE